MEILLRVKGLYRVTMETKAEPNAAAEKIKWHNRRDEAYGIVEHPSGICTKACTSTEFAPGQDVEAAIAIWKERNRSTKALIPCGN